MATMTLYNNDVIQYEGCPGCAYANHEFHLASGMVYEDELFTLSQDWELPIPGFMVLSPKRHVVSLNELSLDEQIAMFKLLNQALSFLKTEAGYEFYNVIFEEKPKRHFHIWLMPRLAWMHDVAPGLTMDIGTIFTYAKTNMRTEENYQKIAEISKRLELHMQTTHDL